jgi:hypothetical protein
MPLVLVCSLIISMGYSAFGQNRISNEKYQLSFLKDSLKINVGQFGFNSFTIFNPSNTKMSLSLKLAMPRGWNLVNQLEPLLEIEAGQSVTVPLRIAPSTNSIGNIVYPITLFVNNNFTNNEESYRFQTKISQLIKWNATLPNQILNITKEDSIPRFTIKISNGGNKKELFLVDFKSDLRLSHSSSGTQVLLAPGKDTTLSVFIRSKSKISTSSYVYIDITSRDGVKQLQQQVFFISDVYYAHPSKYANLTLNTSFFGLNLLLNKSRFGYFETDGLYDLGKNRNFNFRYRSGALSLSDNFSPAFRQFNYFSTKFQASVGSQIDFMNYQIDGNGVNFVFQNHDFQKTELFGIKSRIGNVDLIGFRNDLSIGKVNYMKSNALFVRDNKFETTNFFGMHNLFLKLSNNQRLTLTGGYSTEKAIKIGVLHPGYAYGYRYEANGKVLNIKSNYVYYSPFFPGITRGLLIAEHEARAFLGKIYFGAFADKNNRQPIIYTQENTVANEVFQFSNQSFGGKVGFGFRATSMDFSLAKVTLLQDSLNNPRMEGFKGVINYNYTRKNLNNSVNMSMTRSSLGDFNNGKQYNAFNVFANSRYKKLGLMATYEYGPNYYFDFIYLKNTGIYTERKNFSLFYEAKNYNSNFINRMSLGYMQFFKAADPILLMRNDINLNIPKIRGGLNIVAAFDVLKPKSSPNLSLVFKRTFNVPMAIAPKYHSIRLFLFKDENGNEIFDKGEEPIENANLVINGNNVLTNKNGFASYKNSEKGEHIIDYRNVRNLKGWIASKGVRDTLMLSGSINIGVPFKRSKMISGRVVFNKEYATDAQPPSLNGVLVVAVNRKGEIFKAITDFQGEFFFNLNDDIYNIQIPDNIFGENLFIEKSIKTVDLRNSSSSNLEFKILQKKRKINIRKQ